MNKLLEVFARRKYAEGQRLEGAKGELLELAEGLVYLETLVKKFPACAIPPCVWVLEGWDGGDNEHARWPTQMRKSVLLVLIIGAALTAHSQTFVSRSDTFAFNQANVITSWDGSDPNNPPYPYHMGSVNLGESSSGIIIPFELAYLNGGDLNPCDQIVWGPQTWVIGDGKHDGDTFTKSSGSFTDNVFTPGPTACPYFTGEYGTSGNSDKTFDGFSVIVTYVRHFHRVCQRFRPCQIVPFDTLTGGTGTATQTVIE